MNKYLEVPVGNQKALIDLEDADLVLAHRWALHKSNKTCYAFTEIAGRKTYLHRLIMRLPHGDTREVDHVHHNGLDCRKSEMRVCSRSQNCLNTRKFKGRSLLKGVIFEVLKGRWRARIYYSKTVRKSLGYFDSEQEAHEAWLRAAAERKAA